MTSFLVTLIPGPLVIRWLKRRFRERIASDSRRLDELHAAKQGTPTMGGVLMAVGALAGMLLCSRETLGGAVRWQAVTCLVGFSLLGAWDDYVKARSGRKGLTVRQKLTGQLVIAGLVGVWQAWSSESDCGWNDVSRLGFWVSVVWTTVWVAGGSNAVNLTDGLDGLAAGSVVLSGAGLSVVIGLWSSRPEWSVIAGIVAATSAGFLWYNRHPARVFMGDTGALPLGALLGLCGTGAGIEWQTLGCCLVFVAELFSVVLQVLWFRRTGRRLLLCSPLHNHFVFAGVSERRIVGRFWLFGLLSSGATVGLAWLMS
ncbi:MAG: phospho-N-acetylmuramoyl-pentapeptide-transferase [Planctomycetota bacterium]